MSTSASTGSRAAYPWRRARPEARDEQGFTLIEVVVALAIAAAGLAVLMPWLGDALSDNRRTENYVEATVLAESVLDTIGTAAPMADGQAEDQRKGIFRIRATVDRYRPAEALAETVGYQVPYELTAAVSWREGERTRSVTLRTVRLGAPR